MHLFENATIVGRSMGENNIVVVMDELTGKTVSLQNPNGLELEIGSEGTVEFDALSGQLICFEAIMVEELA